MGPKSNDWSSYERKVVGDVTREYRKDAHVKTEVENGVYATTSQDMPGVTRNWKR